MMGMETWVLVVWLLTPGSGGSGDRPPVPKAITYPDEVACKKGFERARSSKVYTVTGKSQCVRFVPVVE